MARTAVRRRLSWQTAIVGEVVNQTPTARTLSLDVADSPGHRAGQHVDIRLTAEDGYQAERAYSIASAPGEPLGITVEDVIYRDELSVPREGLAVIYALTRSQPAGWAGYARRVDEAMLAEVAWPAADKPLAYVCGPTSFVETVAAGLVGLGYPPARVRTEMTTTTGVCGTCGAISQVAELTYRVWPAWPLLSAGTYLKDGVCLSSRPHPWNPTLAVTVTGGFPPSGKPTLPRARAENLAPNPGVVSGLWSYRRVRPFAACWNGRGSPARRPWGPSRPAWRARRPRSCRRRSCPRCASTRRRAAGPARRRR
jgi:hypothetical protein